MQKSQAVKEARDNPSSITHNHSDVSNNNKDGTREEVLYKGRGPFSNAVTKAFDKDKNSFELLTLQLPRFKIKKDIHGSTYCCYLVVIAVNGTKFTHFFQLFYQFLFFSHSPLIEPSHFFSYFSWIRYKLWYLEAIQ